MLPAVRPGIITVGAVRVPRGLERLHRPADPAQPTTKKAPLPLAIATLRQQTMGVIDYGATEAGVIVMAIPCLVLFFLPPGPLRPGLHVGRGEGMTQQRVRPDAVPRRDRRPRGPVPLPDRLEPARLDQPPGGHPAGQRLRAGQLRPAAPLRQRRGPVLPQLHDHLGRDRLLHAGRLGLRRLRVRPVHVPRPGRAVPADPGDPDGPVRDAADPAVRAAARDRAAELAARASASC